MQAQIIVCKEATLDESTKSYFLDDILNRLEVPTLPYVITISVFIKLFNVPIDKTVDLSIQVIDPDKQSIALTEPLVVRNHRSAFQVPGVDTAMKLSFVLCKRGTTLVGLNIDGHFNVVQYPLYIH